MGRCRTRRSRAGEVLGFLASQAGCVAVYGCLRQCPLLGPGHHDARSRGEAGSADLRDAIRQEAEDRSGRRDLRSGAASDHALHDGQDRSAFTNWLRGPSGLWPRPSGSMRRDSSRHRQCYHEPSPRPGRAGQSQEAVVLGMASALGVGVLENHVFAHMWFDVASAN